MRGKYISYIKSILKKVITNTELAEHWSIAPKGNTGLGSCKILVPFPSTDQYMNLFCMCLCLKKPYLIATVDSSTLNSGPELRLMPEPSLSITHIPCQWHPSLLELRSAGQHFGGISGGSFKCRITNQKYRNERNVTQKRTRVYRIRAEPRRQSVALYLGSCGYACQVIQTFLPLHMPRNDHHKYWFGGYE